MSTSCILGCNDDEYMCPDGTCIVEEWICDGYRDCSDGADESDCGKVLTTISPPASFSYLHTHACIEWSCTHIPQIFVQHLPSCARVGSIYLSIGCVMTVRTVLMEAMSIKDVVCYFSTAFQITLFTFLPHLCSTSNWNCSRYDSYFMHFCSCV